MSKEEYYWIPIELWNLNEVFTTESLSPISFYKNRGFGNPINRNSQKIESENNLILFNKKVQSKILLRIDASLLDSTNLLVIKNHKKEKIKSFEYSKTIYFKKELIRVYFYSQVIRNDFLNNTFMLLEVKTVNKYKSNFIVQKEINDIQQKAVYQTKLYSQSDETQPFFDKAFNQIKGLIYGYFIGLRGVVDVKEQSLISNLTKLKNLIASSHTDIVLSENYTNHWVINVQKIIKDCSSSYIDNFSKTSDVFDTLKLRLKEIDNLNKMRCEELRNQKEINLKQDYESKLGHLETAKRKLYEFEDDNNITLLKEELNQIKKQEKQRGNAKGKTREYFKKGTEEFIRKQELKYLIEDFKSNNQYSELRAQVYRLEEDLRSYQFGFTKFDSSISEQFSRIAEYLHDITKQTLSHFLLKKNKDNIYPDISFEVDINKLSLYYQNPIKDSIDFSIVLPQTLRNSLSKKDLSLIGIILNSILINTQGRLGSYSEKKVLDIVIAIGEKLPESNVNRNVLRQYYKFRKGESVDFIFPSDNILASFLIFIMKLNGHDQITKMLIKKNIQQKEFSLMFYGAYVGFANMPKTFTNVIFDSDNSKLLDFIDNFLFSRVLKYIKE